MAALSSMVLVFESQWARELPPIGRINQNIRDGFFGKAAIQPHTPSSAHSTRAAINQNEFAINIVGPYTPIR